ncbi:mechanosensitive ion channel [Xylophilus rhododendri]|uniref:Mechanosensitive ion channel n=1 Tax=Xylophilus rhododendri TaxID=2697032 RepID=A0A857JB83_9BURK|nr:mechanosensitive ion channel domain-containing protein [Xylophilus rhododendri]QHJ01197.1 mechanosensitive ion channel [Xylophilus rhododendri]
MQALQKLIADFHASDPWLGLLLLALCLAVAWLLAKRLGRGQSQGAASVWFGRHTADGLMFPLLALLLVYAARTGVALYRPAFVLQIAVPVLVSLVVVRLCARVLLSVFPQSPASRLIERFVWWGAWLGAALWVTGLLTPMLAQLEAVSLHFGKTRVDLRTLLEGGLSAGLVLVLTLWVSAAFERRILASSFTDLSLRKAAANVARAVLLLVGLLFVLSTVGVDLTALSVFGGAIGVGLGFGLQKLASNYISGYVMLLERSLHIGDNIRIDSFEGRITDIKTRYTLVRATNGRESIVPNETFITQRVENLSAADLKFRLFTEITVGYDSDVELVRRILAQAAAAQDRVIASPEPVAHLLQFAPDGLMFALNYWIADPAAGQDSVRSAVNLAALAALREAGIELPFPQRVVRMVDTPAN